MLLMTILAYLVTAAVAAITAYFASAYANRGLAVESGDVFFSTYGSCCLGALVGIAVGQLLLSEVFILVLCASTAGAYVGAIVAMVRVTRT